MRICFGSGLIRRKKGLKGTPVDTAPGREALDKKRIGKNYSDKGEKTRGKVDGEKRT